MDRLTSMTVYVKAVELGSFTAAANALTMSPQLVGKHVSVLEQHLGVRLLNRTTRQHSLTEAGHHFYERAKIILAEVEAAESFAEEARIIPRGRLKINAPVTFGINALTQKLPLFINQYPEITIELTLTNRYVDLIDEGYDAVFRVGELADSGLMARKLAPYTLMICASPSYLASASPLHVPEDLLHHECLIFTHTSLRTTWTFEGREGSISIPVSGRLLLDSGEALISAALAGFGVVMQPSELVIPHIEAGRLNAVLPNYTIPPRPFHLMYAPDRRLTPKLRRFLAFATEHFGQETVDS
ncbi:MULTISPECIES: LysR family transcriptional regulator [Pectobacteriaceae]|uniref:LysR family transcriptional regulator n=1 Tax=Affinibrenneria salicis TaxID=2590031 RepID=A0A5J5FRR8_9GAMM|nr:MULTISPECIES: LysR family transcriptional regulator [Pectobacteriaceae]MEE3644449.1 LysR family transcriptional regulator [Brenneria sp. L3_3C_1]MEE3652011.1 LysR family transcriptional regulator [Brenneria sp. HEZEL_4_2_4]MEE3663643.1 LysR family transcriptional regulator [Brenneria sp. g21c3]KAA8995898.1 LysR family transcriptional regulator [Affinibrenneria salicis]MBJ7223207.1 LysR family transcriptional regulator [Brenneria sp. L3-3C-1]